MFFIQICFENNCIKFRFLMDYSKVQKNHDIFFDETEKIKEYTYKSIEYIDYDLLISSFNNFKNVFSDKFRIDKKIDSDVEFRIFDNYSDKNDEIINFIKQNKNLNIVLYPKNYNNIINSLKTENFPNLKIKFENSEKPISYKEFYNMYERLNEIVMFIKHYDLSPLEKTILVYDIVKSNMYKKEDEGEHYSKSRDLNEIINTDKIVCVGYANLINYLLTSLDIKNNFIITYNQERNIGHQKNYIYLNDEKYGIKGAFFLDATADRKKDNDYIDNYKYFLKPFDFFESKKSIIIKPKELNLLIKTNDEISQNILDGHLDELSELLKLLSFLNVKYSLIAVLSQIYNDKEKLDELITFLKKEYNPRSIEETKFKTALYKVRRIEYINNIVKNEITEEYISSIFKKNNKQSEDLKNILRAIGLYEEQNIDKSLANIENIELDNLRMRLLRDLKIYTKDLPDNQYIKKM